MRMEALNTRRLEDSRTRTIAEGGGGVSRRTVLSAEEEGLKQTLLYIRRMKSSLSEEKLTYKRKLGY